MYYILHFPIHFPIHFFPSISLIFPGPLGRRAAHRAAFMKSGAATAAWQCVSLDLPSRERLHN